MSELLPRASARLLSVAIALTIASPSVLAQDAKSNDAATQRALIERLEALERRLGVTGDAGVDGVPGDAADLDRRLRVIERRLELQTEEAAAKAAKEPVVSLAANRGLSIKSPDGLELKLRGLVQEDSGISTLALRLFLSAQTDHAYVDTDTYQRMALDAVEVLGVPGEFPVFIDVRRECLVIDTTNFFEIGTSRFLWGEFINALLAFLLIALIVYFLVVVPVNRLMDMAKTETPVEPTTRECPECLSKIPIKARRCAFCTTVLVSAGDGQVTPAATVS